MLLAFRMPASPNCAISVPRLLFIPPNLCEGTWGSPFGLTRSTLFASKQTLVFKSSTTRKGTSCFVLNTRGTCCFRLLTPLQKNIYLNVHALDSTTTQAELRTWWLEFLALCRQHIKPAHQVVLFVDSNARIGDPQSNYIGSFMPDKQDACGGWFSKLLQLIKCVVPLTFEHSAVGSQYYTFKHSKGSLHRMDHVCVPRGCTHTKS